MNNKLKILFLFVITSLIFITCNINSSETSDIIVPLNFTGPIFIIYNCNNGNNPIQINNVNKYYIPKSGILLIKNNNSKTGRRNYFILKDLNSVVKLRILFPPGHTDLKPSFDDKNLDSNEIFIYGVENFALSDGRKVESYIVGNYYKADSLFHQRNKLYFELDSIVNYIKD